MTEPAVMTPSLTTSLGPVVLVDDDSTTRRMMRVWLASAGYSVVEYEGGAQALTNLPENASVVCLDLGLDDMPGLHVLRHLRARNPDLPIVVATSRGELDSAVESMRAGAYDYLVKPLDRNRLLDSVGRAVERHALASSVRRARAAQEQDGMPATLVGRSAATRELGRQIGRVLESDVTVCVLGESGTGKELVASAIHAGGRRSRAPFVAINCAAIPHSLQESELFGHERGAFTGAQAVHRGRFEQAQGGTLFLDELGEMSPATQAALLRTLQEKSIRRVGGTAEIPLNVRIICATHRDLEEEVRSGRFREDLYFRLVVFPIHVPPLRDRIDDVPPLVGHFLEKLSGDVGREIRRVSPDALAAMMQYRWSGNVRELQNAVHRAMLACDGQEIGIEHLPPNIRSGSLPSVPVIEQTSSAPHVMAEEEGPILRLDELERRAITRALRASGGSVSKAARILGMGRATLYRRIASFGLHPTLES